MRWQKQAASALFRWLPIIYCLALVTLLALDSRKIHIHTRFIFYCTHLLVDREPNVMFLSAMQCSLKLGNGASSMKQPFKAKYVPSNPLIKVIQYLLCCKWKHLVLCDEIHKPLLLVLLHFDRSALELKWGTLTFPESLIKAVLSCTLEERSDMYALGDEKVQRTKLDGAPPRCHIVVPCCPSCALETSSHNRQLQEVLFHKHNMKQRKSLVICSKQEGTSSSDFWLM